MNMDIASIFLGWLLGMLSPVIVRRIDRRYSKNDLYKGILSELDGIQERMILSADLLGEEYGKYDKDFIQWCKDSLSSTRNPNVNILKNWDSQLKLSKDEFDILRTKLLERSKSAKSLKLIDLSFYNLHLSELSLFSIELQALLFELRARVSFYNDEVTKAEQYLRMTFDSSITGSNHEIVKNDLNNKYKIIQDLCIRVSEQIDVIKRAKKI